MDQEVDQRPRLESTLAVIYTHKAVPKLQLQHKQTRDSAITALARILETTLRPTSMVLIALRSHRMVHSLTLSSVIKSLPVVTQVR